MKWRKLGQIFVPDGSVEWMRTHASVPFAENVGGDVFKIYFSGRNESNESSVGYVTIDINHPGTVLSVSPRPVLSKGELGAFDDSGCMGSCLATVNGKKYMYYIGWNLGVTVPFRNAIGVAVCDDGETFSRIFAGPVLDRSRDEPHFVASNCVIFDKGIYKIWYLSCTGWEKIGDGVRHRYHIKYAESRDGINWERNGQVAIDYESPYEYAISVPRVIVDGDIYRMWFSSRGTQDIPAYRIRYAESKDGIHWVRSSEIEGIDVSVEGWDSEMICYPFVFDHKGRRYMLYNGNGYGKTGFGLAVLEGS